MKIVQISSLYPPNVIGGAEQTTKICSDAMANLGHKLDIITLKGPVPAESTPGVTVHEIPLANIYWPFNQASRVPTTPEKIIWHGIDTANPIMVGRVIAKLREIQPDVVITHNLQGFSTAVLPAIRNIGLPLVHVVHDYSLLCPQTTLTRDGNPCGLHKDRCTRCRILTAPRFQHQQAVDAVVGVSEAVLNLHLEHGLFANKPHTFIYNALKPSIKILDQLPQRESGHVFTYGFLGRVEKSKGVETMLKAAEQLEKNGIKFRLLIAGKAKPEYLDYLRATFPLSSVEYVGYVNPVEFLPSLDTLIFPSEWMEALGNGVFEAFAHGVPVIGANVGGIPETIQDGINGVVFEAGNWSQLAQHMHSLHANPALQKHYAAAALTKAREYMPAQRAGEYVAFLDMILREKAGQRLAV